jgi:lantibiotic modifying enzyme
MNTWNARRGTTADAARSIVRDVAERLRRGADAIDEGGVAAGDAGIALFFGALDRDAPNDGWDTIAHGFLKRGADRIGASTPHIGLFGGLAGLGYTTAFLSRSGARYRRVQAEIDAALLPAAEAAARALTPQTGMRVEEYDLVSGLSGIAASLLDRLHNDQVLASARIIIEALVTIVQRAGPVPAWYTPANLITSREMIGRFPDGALNCGLAHGLPGILSVLALAQCAGLRVHGLGAAIRDTADWLVLQRMTDSSGHSWPAAVAPAGATAGSTRGPRAWCYGAPGVARALRHAAVALGDTTLRDIALESLLAVHAQTRAGRGWASPTFCHGIAGVLLITMRFAAETPSPALEDAVAALLERLAAAYSSAAIFGFRAHDAGTGPVDRPGLLDGAAGSALVLHAATSEHDPSWDRLFLLS